MFRLSQEVMKGMLYGLLVGVITSTTLFIFMVLYGFISPTNINGFIWLTIPLITVMVCIIGGLYANNINDVIFLSVIMIVILGGLVLINIFY